VLQPKRDTAGQSRKTTVQETPKNRLEIFQVDIIFAHSYSSATR
jgi:hypothetical protein